MDMDLVNSTLMLNEAFGFKKKKKISPAADTMNKLFTNEMNKAEITKLKSFPSKLKYFTNQYNIQKKNNTIPEGVTPANILHHLDIRNGISSGFVNASVTMYYVSRYTGAGLESYVKPNAQKVLSEYKQLHSFLSKWCKEQNLEKSWNDLLKRMDTLINEKKKDIDKEEY